MNEPIIQLENQKTELKELIEEREKEMRVLSKRVSELQVEIIGLKGGLTATEKIIKELKE